MLAGVAGRLAPVCRAGAEGRPSTAGGLAGTRGTFSVTTTAGEPGRPVSAPSAAVIEGPPTRKTSRMTVAGASISLSARAHSAAWQTIEPRREIPKRPWDRKGNGAVRSPGGCERASRLLDALIAVPTRRARTNG